MKEPKHVNMKSIISWGQLREGDRPGGGAGASVDSMPHYYQHDACNARRIVAERRMTAARKRVG
jgi:hypothetical protein